MLLEKNSGISWGFHTRMAPAPPVLPKARTFHRRSPPWRHPQQCLKALDLDINGETTSDMPALFTPAIHSLFPALILSSMQVYEKICDLNK